MEDADNDDQDGGWLNVSSGTGSPGYSRIKGRKTVVVFLCVQYCLLLAFICTITYTCTHAVLVSIFQVNLHFSAPLTQKENLWCKFYSPGNEMELKSLTQARENHRPASFH